MTTTGKTGKSASQPNIAEGDRDRILERHVAQVNGHDLARCESWDGPGTTEEESSWYVFYACEHCGTEATLPPHRWETIPCRSEI